MKQCLYVLLAGLLLWALPAAGWASTQVIRTQHFDIIYPYPEGQLLAEHLAEHADHEYQNLWQQLAMPIAPRVSLVLSDSFGDQVNGFASLGGPPLVHLALNNTDMYELTGHGDSVVNTLRHELVHIFAGRRYSDKVSWMPYLGYGLTPNLFAPLAFHEGYAIWFETDSETGQGRALRHNPFYEGMWRQQYLQGFLGYQQALAEQGHLGYLYGAYFFTWAEEQHGPELVSRWLAERANRGSMLRLVHLEPSWRRLTGESFAHSWQRFLAFEQQRLGHQDQDAPSWTTKASALSSNRNYQAIYRDAEVFAWVEHQEGHKPARLRVDYQGESRSLAYQPQLLVRQDQYLWFNQYQMCKGRPLYSLYRLSLDTGQVERMQSCQRVSHLTWSEPAQAFAAWQLTDQGAELLLLDKDAEVLVQLQSFAANVGLQSLAWHPDGQSLLLHKKADWQQNYDLFSLDLASQQWSRLTQDQHLYLDARYLDAERLIYSRQQGSYLQAFVWHLASGQEQQLTQLPQNALSPQLDGQQLTLVTEDQWGYQLVSLSPLAQLQAKPLQQVPHQPVELSSNGRIRHNYYPIEQLRLAAFTPTVSGNAEGPILGFGLGFIDPLQRHEIMLLWRYEFGSTNVVGGLNYGYRRGANRYGLVLAEGLTQTETDDEPRRQESGYQLSYDWRSSTGRWSLGTSWLVDQRFLASERDAKGWLGGSLVLADSQYGGKRHLPYRAGSLSLTGDWSPQTEASSAELGLSLAHATLGQSALLLNASLHWTDDDQQISSTSAAISTLVPRKVTTGLGLQGIDQPLLGEWLWLAGAKHPVLLLEPKRTLGTWALGVDRLWLNPYAQVVGDQNQQQYNLGSELQLDLKILWNFPLPVKAGVRWSLDQDQEWSQPMPYIGIGQ